jgi:hypothetical protein
VCDAAQSGVSEVRASQPKRKFGFYGGWKGSSRPTCGGPGAGRDRQPSGALTLGSLPS